MENYWGKFKMTYSGSSETRKTANKMSALRRVFAVLGHAVRRVFGLSVFLARSN